MKKSARRVQLALEVAGAECRALELPAAARFSERGGCRDWL